MYVSSHTCNGTYGVGCNENSTCHGTPTACGTYIDSVTCGGQSGCSWGQEPSGYFDGDFFCATDTGNKFGVFGSSGAVRWTTGSATVAAFVQGGGTGVMVTDISTFDGYTIGQVVKALRAWGWLQ
jgi:hypothetical protein